MVRIIRHFAYAFLRKGTRSHSSLNLCGIHIYDAISGQSRRYLLSIGANIRLATRNWLRLMFRRWIPGKWTTRVRKFYNVVFENKNSVFLISVFFFFLRNYFKNIINFKYYALLKIKFIRVGLCKRKINDWKNDRNNFYANILNRRVRSGVSFLRSLSPSLLSLSLVIISILLSTNNMWLTTENREKKNQSDLFLHDRTRRPCVECSRVTSSAFNFTILSRDFYSHLSNLISLTVAVHLIT